MIYFTRAPKKLMIFGEIFLARAQCIIRSGQDSAVVPARLANHSTEFFLSCQTVELRSDERALKMTSPPKRDKHA